MKCNRKFLTAVGVILALSVSLGLFGCGEDEEADASAPALSKTVEQDGATLEWTLSSQKILISETALVTLTLTVPDTLTIIPPEFKDNETWMLAQRTIAPRERLDSKRIQQKMRFAFEPLASGRYALPTLRTELRGGEKAIHLSTEPIEVSVTALLKDPAQAKLHDINDAVKIPQSYTEIIIGGAITGAIVGALAGLVLVLILRGKAPPPPPPAKLAHEIAFAAFARLKDEKLIERGLFKEYIQRLSGILRYYLEDRFGLRAPEQTTEEFLADLREAAVLDNDQKSTLKTFLEQCDWIKFANGTLAFDEGRAMMETAEHLVRQTMPSPTGVDAEAEAAHAV